MHYKKNLNEKLKTLWLSDFFGTKTKVDRKNHNLICKDKIKLNVSQPKLSLNNVKCVFINKISLIWYILCLLKVPTQIGI